MVIGETATTVIPRRIVVGVGGVGRLGHPATQVPRSAFYLLPRPLTGPQYHQLAFSIPKGGGKSGPPIPHRSLSADFLQFGRHLRMASYPPAEKASTAGDSGVLATTCHGLRVANEQLREVNREICRLTVARMMYFPSGSELPDRLLDREYEKYKRESFGDCDIFVSEWWKRATRNCLLESVGNLDRELEKTKTSRTGFESIQSALRCHIDKLSRPYLRNLSLLDLPDEILLMILERVENLDFDLRFLLSLLQQWQRGYQEHPPSLSTTL